MMSPRRVYKSNNSPLATRGQRTFPANAGQCRKHRSAVRSAVTRRSRVDGIFLTSLARRRNMLARDDLSNPDHEYGEVLPKPAEPNANPPNRQGLVDLASALAGCTRQHSCSRCRHGIRNRPPEAHKSRK